MYIPGSGNITCNNSTISGNLVQNDTGGGVGIYAIGDSNKIVDNTCELNYYGIVAEGEYTKIFSNEIRNHSLISLAIIGNYTETWDNKIYNNSRGVELVGQYNLVESNQIIDNVDFGLYIGRSNNNNNITQNLIENNRKIGIKLGDNKWNEITDNSINNNHESGIFLDNCNDTYIQNNTISGNYLNGVHLTSHSDYNIISGNNINQNSQYGIGLDDFCQFNRIYENNISFNNVAGISLSRNISGTLIRDNIINHQVDVGIQMAFDCDFNTIISNILDGNNVGLVLDDCDWNTITLNTFTSDLEDILLYNASENNYFIENIFSIFYSTFNLRLVKQNFTEHDFLLTIFIHDEYGSGIEDTNLEVEWNSIMIPQTDITETGYGYYQIRLEPYFVNPGDYSILLKISLSKAGFNNLIYNLSVAVEEKAEEVEEVPSELFLDITQEYITPNEIIIKFILYNAKFENISDASILAYWNSTDVSSGITQIGEGYYQLKLDPIFIDLDMEVPRLILIISVPGYDDLNREIFLTLLNEVDGEPIDDSKGISFGFDFLPIAVLFSVSLYFWKKKKLVTNFF